MKTSERYSLRSNGVSRCEEFSFQDERAKRSDANLEVVER